MSSFLHILVKSSIIQNIVMFSGKIYRNKPIDLQKQACQTDFGASRSPLRKVMSNGHLLQTYSSHLDTDQNEEIYQEVERNKFGVARQHIERSERRMKEKINSLERMYTLSLEELQKTVEEKDLVIRALKDALEEKDRVIESLKRENQEALESSRSIIREKFPLRL